MGGLGDQDQDPLGRGIPKTATGGGITVLGAPVGYDGFLKEGLRAKVEKVRQLTALLPLLRDPHSEFVLLRSCLSLPKVMFLLRALDTSGFGDLLEEFDLITRDATSRILGKPVSNVQWEQAKLPLSMGGLGLRAAADHAPVAHAVSLLTAQPLIKRLLGKNEEEEDAFTLPAPLLDSISARQGEEVVTESLVGVTQKMASLKIDLHNHSLLLNFFKAGGDVRENARMASLGLPHAGDWLTPVPCPALGLHLRGPEFVACLKYRLGVPVFLHDGQCPACHQQSDKLGDHALGCQQTGDRIARHNRLRDVLFEAAAGAALGPVREERHLLPGTAAKPADVLIPRWIDGKDGALDVTVTSPLSASNVAAAASEAGGALLKAVKRKAQGAAQACQDQGLSFLPVAVETLGGLHKTACEQIKRIGTSVARQTGGDERISTRQLYQRFALTLMRGNAALLISRSPDADILPPEVDGAT